MFPPRGITPQSIPVSHRDSVPVPCQYLRDRNWDALQHAPLQAVCSDGWVSVGHPPPLAAVVPDGDAEGRLRGRRLGVGGPGGRACRSARSGGVGGILIYCFRVPCPFLDAVLLVGRCLGSDIERVCRPEGVYYMLLDMHPSGTIRRREVVT